MLSLQNPARGSQRGAALVVFSTVLLALIGLLFVQSVLALDWGRARLLSGVGQPLSVEIPIHDVAEPSQLTLQVQAGQARDAGLAGRQSLSVSASVHPRLDGASGVVVVVTSAAVVTDPVVDLVLTLTTPEAQAPRRLILLLPATRPSTITPISLAALPVGDTLRVQAGDTLGEIANRLRQQAGYDEVTVFQVLAGLFQANPQAFIQGNMNLVRAGVTLQIPEASAVRAIDRQVARQLYQSHLEAFQAMRGRGAQARATAVSPVALDAGSEADAGMVAPPAPVPAPTTGRDTLRLSSLLPSDGTAHAATRDAQAVIDQLRDERAATQRALADAQGRVGELEDTVREMESLLALQNEALARLQLQAREAAEQARQSESVSEPAVGPAVVPSMAGAVGVASQPASAMPAPAPAEPIAETAAEPALEADVVAASPVPEPTTSQGLIGPSPTPAPRLPEAEPVVPVEADVAPPRLTVPPPVSVDAATDPQPEVAEPVLPESAGVSQAAAAVGATREPAVEGPVVSPSAQPEPLSDLRAHAQPQAASAADSPPLLQSDPEPGPAAEPSPSAPLTGSEPVASAPVATPSQPSPAAPAPDTVSEAASTRAASAPSVAAEPVPAATAPVAPATEPSTSVPSSAPASEPPREPAPAPAMTDASSAVTEPAPAPVAPEPPGVPPSASPVESTAAPAPAAAVPSEPAAAAEVPASVSAPASDTTPTPQPALAVPAPEPAVIQEPSSVVPATSPEVAPDTVPPSAPLEPSPPVPASADPTLQPLADLSEPEPSAPLEQGQAHMPALESPPPARPQDSAASGESPVAPGVGSESVAEAAVVADARQIPWAGLAALALFGLLVIWLIFRRRKDVLPLEADDSATSAPGAAPPLKVDFDLDLDSPPSDERKRTTDDKS